MGNVTPISFEMREAASQFARELSVSSSLHEQDFIFQFLINNPVFQGSRDAIHYYFYDGRNSAEKFARLISELGFPAATAPRVLEFASGYGCVSRHLKDVLAGASILSCDIHQDAVDFIQTNLGMAAAVSASTPERLSVTGPFEVVFALSFFSHMPRLTWGRWMKVLYDRVAPGGVLVFTTHGVTSAKNHFGDPAIPADGFWFKPESEQADLSVQEYGQTIVLEPFVHSQVATIPGAVLERFQEAYWWNHQDLVVVRKPS